MDLETLTALCQDFNDLGGAVSGQLIDVIDGGNLSDQNPNALAMCQKFLREAARLDVEGANELADRIKEHLAQIEKVEG